MSDYWQRFADRRLSRRSVLRAAGIGAAAAAAIPLGGCSGGSTTTTGAGVTPATTPSPNGPDLLNTGGTPRRGGRFLTSEAADFGTFDPHLGIALASAYFPRLYNVLVNQCATKAEFMYFDLASALETPDPLTFIFKIRPGVRVAPNDLGVPERDLDPEDVRVSLERIRTTKAANNYAFAHQYIASITTTADTVTVKTTTPYAWFLNRIGLFVNTIPPRELLSGDLKRLEQHAAGAGPYRLTSLHEGQGATFDRNPNYYRKDDRTGQQLPYVDGIDLKLLFDRTAARTAFLSHQLDRYVPASASEAAGLQDRFTIERDPNFSFIAFAMNPQQPPFQDPRVRRAISRAIDRQAYIDIIYGGQAKADGLVHWPVGAYALDDAALKQTYQPFDLQEAKRLVSAVGGIKLKMMYPSGTLLEEHDKHLPIFIGQMNDAGISIDHDPQDLPTWIENFSKLNYHCSLSLNQIYETAEIPLGFHTTAGPLGDGTYVRGLGDPQIEAAVKKANETIDVNARVTAVHDAQKIIYGKVPAYYPLVTPYMFQAYWPSVHNIPAGVGTTQFLLNMFWLDSPAKA
ncbi:MAG TPA: ABC transporter substrate-binding protein [Dehalococcoidia bacterium]|nr:ABC transporter substrate-binding protein [Dehalococcoidia bacterium]